MKPLINQNTNVDNLTTYLQLELAKTVRNNDSICFTTRKDLTANVVVKSAIKDFSNSSSLANANPISITKGTKLFVPLAELPYTLTDTDLTIQYALNSNGECLQFIAKSLFDGYVVRHLTVSLIDGSIRIKPSQPKPVKLKKPEKQLATAKQWYKDQMKQLGLNSIAEVDTYYNMTHRQFWRLWSEINPTDFEPSPSDYQIENFYKVLGPYKESLKYQ